jgi:hypothetical protein
VEGIFSSFSLDFLLRDVYIHCFKREEQINETQFDFDKRLGFYVQNNALWGYEGNSETGKEVDLIEHILTYQSESFLFSSDVINSVLVRQRGNKTSF